MVDVWHCTPEVVPGVLIGFREKGRAGVYEPPRICNFIFFS